MKYQICVIIKNKSFKNELSFESHGSCHFSWKGALLESNVLLIAIDYMKYEYEWYFSQPKGLARPSKTDLGKHW